MASSGGVIRLQKELKIILCRKKVESYIALPDSKNIFEWHFLIFGLKGCDYEGGFYHGRLMFPPEYPMKPPSIILFTPSGRFEVNTKICTSFSDFHPETWNPLWTVETIIVGLISFMMSEENSTGTVKCSSA
jgi:ubiquitin-conjugating enzyme E2 J2